MPAHDPYCPAAAWPTSVECPYCKDMIVVRADEQERIVDGIEAARFTAPHWDKSQEWVDGFLFAIALCQRIARGSELGPMPERTAEMAANGQVWVGMTYPDGSRGWEVRGTGVTGFDLGEPGDAEGY